MSATGVFRPAPLWSRLYDCLSPVTTLATAQVLSKRFDGAGRYLETLTLAERDRLWQAGTPILLLSTAPYSGALSTDTGNALADGDDAHCVRLEVPPSGHLVLDAEAFHDPVDRVLDYLRARSRRAVLRGAVGALVYLGADQPMTGVQAYAELPDAHAYGRGGSLGIAEPPCEFCWWQIPPLDQVVEGQQVDGSCTGRDARGRAPLLWWPS